MNKLLKIDFATDKQYKYHEDLLNHHYKIIDWSNGKWLEVKYIWGTQEYIIRYLLNGKWECYVRDFLL